MDGQSELTCAATHKHQEELFTGLRSKWREDQRPGDKALEIKEKVRRLEEMWSRKTVLACSQVDKGNGAMAMRSKSSVLQMESLDELYPIVVL